MGCIIISNGFFDFDLSLCKPINNAFQMVRLFEESFLLYVKGEWVCFPSWPAPREHDTMAPI